MLNLNLILMKINFDQIIFIKYLLTFIDFIIFLLFRLSNYLGNIFLILLTRKIYSSHWHFVIFSFQQLFRSQPQGATPQQLQLLQQQQQQQQQQYLAASQAQQQQQQQQQQNFPTAPYTVISGQEPYVGALIAGAPPPVVPQYYGVGPWVYPAGLLPQAPPQAAAPPPPRRPLTPSSVAVAAAAAQDTANNLAQTVS